MTIALIADPLDLQTAGIHTYTRMLVACLREYLPEAELLVVRSGDGSAEEGGEVRVPVRRFLPGHQRLRQFWHIPRRLNRLRPDVVIEPAHFGPFNLRTGIRRITVVHDLTPLLHPQWHERGSVLAHRYLLPGVLRRADRVVAVSPHTAGDLQRLFPHVTSRLEVIAPALDPDFRPADSQEVRLKYGLNQPYFLHLGTLEPRKNISTLIRAFEIFRQKNPQEKSLLALAGKWGWKSRALRQQLEGSPFAGDIHLLGYVPREELPALYSGARVFVFPSHYEGFGYPVAEALACGARVLASDRASLREFQHPLLSFFSPQDEHGLAKLMQQLIRGEQRPASEAGEAFRQKYSVARMGEEWRNLLQMLSS